MRDVTPQTPVTQLKLMKGVPLSKNYINVLSNPSDGMFSSYVVNTQGDYGVLVADDTIRVDHSPEYVSQCNYLSFINNNYGYAKRVYAFIDKVRRLSINSCLVDITVDAFTTNWGDVTLQASYVEREHAVTDTFGANQEPEPFNVGDMKRYSFYMIGLGGSKTICVAYTYTDPEAEEGQVSAGFISGIFSGCNIAKFSDPYSAATFLSQFATKNMVDAVAAVYQLPSEIANDSTLSPASKTTSVAANLNSLDGYTPRNKKLLQYPYNYAQLTSPSGQSIDLRYEYFDSFPMQFVAYGEGSPSGSQIAYPINYGGGSSELSVGFNSGAMCAWSSDSWAQWCSSQGIGTGIAVVGSALAVGAGLASGGIALPIIGGALGIASSINNVAQAQRRPDQLHGSISGNLSHALGEVITVNQMGISASKAESIDAFFDRYGYATNKIKVPNINSRPHYNYVKCAEATVTGDVSHGDLETIQNALNRGTTFWKQLSEVGNFGLSNGA